ncbi:MAG: hypothetical protein IPL49_19940 [Saprospirales bacterium]|nr:hypothetical protein [Saprospirales bacterium]MBK8493086.1 hypothetical protein [Saprospirales bacterium]
MINRFILIAGILGIFSWGCQHFNDLENVETIGNDAEYAIPLINTSVSLDDLLEKLDKYTYLDIDSNNLIFLRYKGDVVTKTSQEIFKNIELALPPLIPVLDTVMPLPFTTPDGIEMDYVELKSGFLYYAYKSYHEDDLSMKIRFPQVFKPNGDILEFNNVINYSGTLPVETVLLAPYNLKDHKLIADSEGNLRIEYIALHSNGVRDTVSNFNIALTNVEFSYAEGYFGNQLHDGKRDTINIEFFETWTKGDVYFEDPKIFVNVFNSFGVPTRSIVNVFDITTADGNVLSLQSDAIDNGIDFDYPELPDEVGETKITQFSFTKDNSNIDVVLGSKPVALDYDVDAITNPDNVTAIRGFITDSSRYTVSVEVELPIYGRSSSFVAIDTVDVDFSSYDNVKEMEFKVFAENFLPIRVGIQAYMEDEFGVVIDSLLATPQTLIAAAPVDAAGDVINPVKHVLYVPVAGARLENLRRTKRIVVEAAFSTYNEGNTSVKVYADQHVNIGVGLRLKMKD